MDGDAIPVLNISLARLDDLQFLLRIIDERAELFLLRLSDIVAKEFVYFSFDISRGVLQHMTESFTFTMYISQEVLCAFG